MVIKVRNQMPEDINFVSATVFGQFDSWVSCKQSVTGTQSNLGSILEYITIRKEEI